MRHPAHQVRRRDERAVETAAMLIVLPILIVLVLTLIDVGLSLRTRMLVENAARDGARGVAADGGNYNPRTASNNLPAGGWSDVVMGELWDGTGCRFSRCSERPTVNCTPQVVAQSGDIVSCQVTYFPKAINGGLLNSPLGLGMGALLPETITITAQARAETGDNG